LNQEIMEITDKIKKTVDCERIYLFGSHAYGTPKIDSDYDFYVVIPDDTIRPIEAMQKIYSTLSKTNMLTPVDVLASYASQFEERKSLPTLESKVAKEGIMLYERNGLSM